MNLYVGNLSPETTDYDLEDAFGKFGKVSVARVNIDRQTGRSRGFGFVDMPLKEESDAAILGMNGKEFKGRTLTVNEARSR
ncbi:MAG: RNA-binding protein [Chloroflexi bacterium]|nr:RNA-binding protein [Chloroflexota bacterium]